MAEETVEIRLPAELCTAALQRLGSRFANIEEFVLFVMHEVVANEVQKLDEAERRMVEERLRDLGYV
jgi:hypothetical protein